MENIYESELDYSSFEGVSEIKFETVLSDDVKKYKYAIIKPRNTFYFVRYVDSETHTFRFRTIFELGSINIVKSAGAPITIDKSEPIHLIRDIDPIHYESLYSSVNLSNYKTYLANKKANDIKEKLSPILDVYYKDDWDFNLTSNLKQSNSAYNELDSSFHFCVTIRFKHIIIKNNKKNKSHTIKDLFVLLQLNENSVKPVLYGCRGTISHEEYHAGYSHSHLRASRFGLFTSFCMGDLDNPITGILHNLSFELKLDSFDLFLLHLSNMVAYESLEGVPYIQFSNVKPVALGTPLGHKTFDKSIYDVLSPDDFRIDINTEYIPDVNNLLKVSLDKDKITHKYPNYIVHKINTQYYEYGTLVKDKSDDIILSGKIIFNGQNIPIKVVNVSDTNIEAADELDPNLIAKIEHTINRRVNDINKL